MRRLMYWLAGTGMLTCTALHAQSPGGPTDIGEAKSQEEGHEVLWRVSAQEYLQWQARLRPAGAIAPAGPAAVSEPGPAPASPPASPSAVPSGNREPSAAAEAPSPIATPAPPPLTQTSAPPPIPSWRVQTEDGTLYQTLARWSALAGWQLVWETDRDFPIESNFELSGEFVAVLGTVMDTLRDSDFPLQAVINRHTRVVRIVRHMEYAHR